MRKNFPKFLVVAFSMVMLTTSSCDDDPDPMDPPKQDITVMLNHEWNGSLLKNNNWYVTNNSDSFQLTKMTYHVNHFQFKDEEGNWHDAKDTWFMVNSETTMSPVFNMGNLDGKSVIAVRFDIGVADSAINASGELNNYFTDPMYWGMANGYINFKLEGKSPSVSNQGVVLHIGGYKSPYKAYSTVEIDFPSGKKLVGLTGSKALSLDVNLAEFFFNPNNIDLKTTNELQTPGAMAVSISQNWPDMFTFKSIQ